MKRLFVLITLMVVISLNNVTYAQAEKAKDPYTADYSSSFKLGNQAYAKMVLELWKDWDDNMLDRHKYFADSITMVFASGTMSKGLKDCMEGAKKYRGSMTAVKSTVHAWVPLRSTDKNEDVVCIWGNDESTSADGKVEKREIHEVWWFNKDGKVFYFRQWTATPTPEK